MVAAPASAQEEVPSFEVAMTAEPAAAADSIFTCCGNGFTPDAEITVQVFDSPAGTSLYGPATITTDADGNFWLTRDVHGLDLVPGMYVEVIDPNIPITKGLTLADISYRSISPGRDVAQGTAPPGSEVYVTVDDYALTVQSYEIVFANSRGVWTADFSSDFDVQPRMGGTVHLQDPDGDTTRAGRVVRSGPEGRP